MRLSHLALLLLIASPLEAQVLQDSTTADCGDSDRLMGLCRHVDTVFVVEKAAVPIQGLKDPGTATLFSLLIPGGGQFYAGETGAGAVYLLTSVAAIGVGYAFARSGCSRYQCRADQTPLYVGLGTSVLIDLISLFDAGPAVRRHNKKLRLTPTGVSFNF